VERFESPALHTAARQATANEAVQWRAQQRRDQASRSRSRN
jgi:hypothetical protein